jgi:2,3-dihydroxybiphenyl 1,2-dioxygenase
MIGALGYLGIRSRDLRAWRDLAARVLGAETLEREADALGVRLDERAQRLEIKESDAPGLVFAGLEAPNDAAWWETRRHLERQGVQTHDASAEERALRKVADFFRIADPDGNRIEIFHGAERAAAPFAPPRPIGGFRIDTLGMGSLALGTVRFAAMSAFYRQALGFKLSDFQGEPDAAVFLRVNPRHHSIAVIAAGAPGIRRVTLELLDLDDLGRAYDAALENASVAVSLGRRASDHLVSFSCRAPDGFLLEIGWAGLVVDDASWQPREVDGASLWGHQAASLAPEERARARESAKAIAAKGVRAPVQLPQAPSAPRRRIR